ncbi:hypothetical protein DWB77_00096 [Streptomyces hundungensis]|uniref:Uncharacterized protein n=1 Tax=Streptomyces hundungensis TaxID=1077946 RepID=A0A387H485_9ACTN|nr:hypothetical protein [Streptomyces hundungensis]AYG77989.1 hypothetical protein DWB77_00096 [Streptomyces hundungensis]
MDVLAESRSPRRMSGVGELSGRLSGQVRGVCDTVRETVIGWRVRPPVLNEAVLAELLAYIRRDLAAVSWRRVPGTLP